MSSFRNAIMLFYEGGMMAREDMVMVRQGELKKLHVIRGRKEEHS
jgi:hypothetical protein